MQPTSLKTAGKRPTVLDRKLAIYALPVDNREDLIHAIRRYLYDRSPEVRSWALRVASKEVLRELEDRVCELLADRTDYVRSYAIECIGKFHGGERIEVPWLYSFLRDPYPLARVETLESLAWIEDRKALPNMVECLRDKDYLVKSYAAISIAELRGKKYRKAIEAASTAEVTEQAKPWFARALFLLGHQQQLFKLLGHLSSPNCTARCGAANAIADIEFSMEQTVSALADVRHALQHFIARSDQSTMERVVKKLAEDAIRMGERSSGSALQLIH